MKVFGLALTTTKYKKHACVSIRQLQCTSEPRKGGMYCPPPPPQSVDGQHVSPFGVIRKGHQMWKWCLLSCTFVCRGNACLAAMSVRLRVLAN